MTQIWVQPAYSDQCFVQLITSVYRKHKNKYFAVIFLVYIQRHEPIKPLQLHMLLSWLSKPECILNSVMGCNQASQQIYTISTIMEAF